MRSLLLSLIIFTFVQWYWTSPVHASRSPGDTTPSVEFAVGGSENITCRMNLQVFGGKNSTSLYFVDEETKQNVSSADIAIENNRTVVYMLRNAVAQNKIYTCKSGQYAIGITRVYVGTAPQNVVDFDCRGYDFQYMVCNFTVPNNTIPTKYNLSYIPQFANHLQICELEIQANNRAICNLTQNNYRKDYEFFNFTLTGFNTLGTNRQHFWVNHYESVIPPRPEFYFENITVNSTMLSWTMVTYSYYISKGLQYEVLVRPEQFDWLHYSNYTIRTTGKQFHIILHDLPYAHHFYNVSLRMKVRKARNDGTMWSEAHVRLLQTKSCPPYEPPATDVGSFYIDATETHVRLYWEEVPFYRRNGPNFQYVVTQKQRVGKDLLEHSTKYTNNTSVAFPWDKKYNYDITIKSRNDIGDSLQHSEIFVPAIEHDYDRKSKRPQWIKSIDNHTYTLSWSPPIDVRDLIDYTVFWCPSKRAVSNECKDSITFEHVAIDKTNFNVDSQQTLNFAVSANYLNFNTGLHWANCTADVSSELAKLQPEVLKNASHYIQLQWSLENVCTSLLEGYNLTYCQIASRSNGTSECVEQSISIKIPETENKYNITNLKPFSSYKIEMYMFSKQKVGKVSNPLHVWTKEDAPSPPRNVTLLNVTSSSVWISWMPPTHLNGILRFYTIFYNNEDVLVDCTSSGIDCAHNSEIHFQLHNLTSYTTYRIYVTAHTVESSLSSNDIYVETLIGVPSHPRHMMPNESHPNLMQWSSPEKPAGRVDFYEVAVIVLYKDQVQRQRISGVVGSAECIVEIPLCIDSDYKHKLQVRAVNVASLREQIDYHLLSTNNTHFNDEDSTFYEGNDELRCTGTLMPEEKQVDMLRTYRNRDFFVQYKSEWEKGPFYGCAAPTNLSRMTIFGMVVIVTGVAAVLYFARIKYKKMSDISCVLPSELTAYSASSVGGGFDNRNIEKDEEFRRSKESLYNNENHHLLSSICNDSGYLGGGRASIIGDVTPGSIGKSSGYVGSDQSDEYAQSDAFAPPRDTSNMADDTYMVMEILKTVKDAVARSNEMNNKVPDSGYVHPSDAKMSHTETKQMVTANLPIIPSTNGYIKPNKILNWQQQVLGSTPVLNEASKHCSSIPLSSNYYIDSTKPAEEQTSVQCSNGYTTLDALGKTSSSLQLKLPHTSPAHIFTSSLPPISGYVTQKELSAFGQQSLS